jgi:hypothetical protein
MWDLMAGPQTDTSMERALVERWRLDDLMSSRRRSQLESLLDDH